MRNKVGISIVMACILLLTAHTDGRARLLHPTSGARMWLSIGGKNRLYFRVESGETTAVQVRGPGEIKCYVRAVAGSASPETIAYSLVISEGNHRLRTVETETVPSSMKWKHGDEIAAKSRSFRLKIPDGDHLFRIAFESKDATAAGIRYVFREAAAHSEQLSLHAVGKRESVTLLVKEKPLDYYVADEQSPVNVNVIGPARLRIVSRLVCPRGARGNQRYTINLQRDGQPLPDKTLVTTKSSVVECESHPDWILGKSKTFYVEIPKGTHVIALRLANADAPGVALRFSIPKEDTANGR